MDTSINVVLAFDFGMKRIGVAVGQTVTNSARPLVTIPAKEGIPELKALTKIIQQWKPDALVIGIPLNMDGTIQPITQHAKNFGIFLKQQFDLPVFEMDERLTTKAARERIFKEGGYKALQNGQVDQVAAQLILQNWLDQNSEQTKE